MRDEVRADALLASLEQEHRGKLKVFLGAAPGVGKTYAMLQAVREQAKEGVDILIGWWRPTAARRPWPCSTS